MNNCINCGAPLHGSKCQYCGTEYGNNGFVCNFDRNDFTGTIRFDGKEYQVYLGKVEGNMVCCGNSGRDITGRMRLDNPIIKRKFTLIEM